MIKNLGNNKMAMTPNENKVRSLIGWTWARVRARTGAHGGVSGTSSGAFLRWAAAARLGASPGILLHPNVGNITLVNKAVTAEQVNANNSVNHTITVNQQILVYCSTGEKMHMHNSTLKDKGVSQLEVQNIQLQQWLKAKKWHIRKLRAPILHMNAQQ